jgi:FtsP/CotA-like multicopper oxidase with cupredoxin domain
MTVAGAAQAPQPLPTRLLPFLDLRSVPIDHRRTVTLQSLPLDRNAPEIPMATFMINSRQFAADRVDQTMRLNTTEEWVVRNASDNWHPFHIHVNPFQVVAVNGRAVAPRSYQDTVPVPPLGEVVLRTQFLDFTGRFVFHCHILQHEDGGMMSVVEVAR